MNITAFEIVNKKPIPVGIRKAKAMVRNIITLVDLWDKKNVMDEEYTYYEVEVLNHSKDELSVNIKQDGVLWSSITILMDYFRRKDGSIEIYLQMNIGDTDGISSVLDIKGMEDDFSSLLKLHHIFDSIGISKPGIPKVTYFEEYVLDIQTVEEMFDL